jgi:hypothetical protein
MANDLLHQRVITVRHQHFACLLYTLAPKPLDSDERAEQLGHDQAKNELPPNI